jgi:hypothetical protein
MSEWSSRRCSESKVHDLRMLNSLLFKWPFLRLELQKINDSVQNFTSCWGLRLPSLGGLFVFPSPRIYLWKARSNWSIFAAIGRGCSCLLANRSILSGLRTACRRIQSSLSLSSRQWGIAVKFVSTIWGTTWALQWLLAPSPIHHVGVFPLIFSSPCIII